MSFPYDYNIEDFLQRQYDSRKPAWPVDGPLSGAVSWEDWRSGFRTAFYEMLGGYPQDVPPLNLQVLKTEKLPGMTRTFLTYDCEHGLTVPAYYLVPDNASGKLPAVVAVCGHGYGVRPVVGVDEEGNDFPPGADSGYHKSFGLELCRKGMVVFAPEMFGFGYLRTKLAIDTHPFHASCKEATDRLRMTGRTTGGVRVYQCVRALEALSQLGHADPQRIGCMGISGGGLVSAFWSALDDRVKASVVSGYAHVMLTGTMKLAHMHCLDNYFHNMLNLGELTDVLAMVAPRPMLWEAADKDIYFPIDSALDAAGRLRQVYAAFGVPERFVVDEFAGPHEISGAMAYDFLKKWL